MSNCSRSSAASVPPISMPWRIRSLAVNCPRASNQKRWTCCGSDRGDSSGSSPSFDGSSTNESESISAPVSLRNAWPANTANSGSVATFLSDQGQQVSERHHLSFRPKQSGRLVWMSRSARRGKHPINARRPPLDRSQTPAVPISTKA